MTPLRKVLVVDDDPVVGRSFERVLSGKGYAVITARDGEEALRKLSAEAYDVVFTDIKMPGMSGLEVAERVKASQPWLPVVIVTGYGTEENEARAEAAGVAEFLRKPLSPEAIEGSAAKVLHETAARALPREAETAVMVPGWGRAIKNVALFFAAPFIGLAYLILGPIVGLAVLAWMGVKALARNDALRRAARYVKNVVLFLAAPFVGLAYILAFPIIGMGALAWMGGKALMRKPAVKKVAGRLGRVGLFIAAPFVGLAYIVIVPVAGLVVLAWMGAKALVRH